MSTVTKPAPFQVTTDPDAVVDGLTIRQWAEEWLRTAFAAPASSAPDGSTVDAFNDPQGTVAQEINSGPSSMYFITTAAPGAVRTFDVPAGENVLLPIAFLEDSEGPNISPSIPGFVPTDGSYADEVRQVLATSHFSNVTLSIDGQPVSGLKETDTGIFSAGIVQAGSSAQAFFAENPPVAPGTPLSTTGEEGYWAVMSGLSPGTHTISSTYSYKSTYLGDSPGVVSQTDIINVT